MSELIRTLVTASVSASWWVVASVLVLMLGLIVRAHLLQFSGWASRMWVRVLTAGLPDGERFERRAVFESEMRDRTKYFRECGFAPDLVAIHLLEDLAKSLPSDIGWRFIDMRAVADAHWRAQHEKAIARELNDYRELASSVVHAASTRLPGRVRESTRSVILAEVNAIDSISFWRALFRLAGYAAILSAVAMFKLFQMVVASPW